MKPIVSFSLFGTEPKYYVGAEKNITEIKFESLNYGDVYNICVETLTSNSFHNCDESRPNQICKLVESRCEQLPGAKKTPSQIFWSVEDDTFNPFNEIKIKMEEGTFDGEASGLSKFIIRSF